MNAALSIDLESYWHAELLRARVDRSSADDRVIAATEPLLDLLSAKGLRATFFVVGEVLHSYPQLLRRIVDEGHEIGCHTHTHRPLWELTKSEFEQELIRFQEEVERHLPGVTPRGFRAPTFSLSADTSWALAALSNHGYSYDSSVFPMKTPLYGVPGCPAAPYHPALNLVEQDPTNPILEWPMTAWRVGPLTIPVCGGFYLRVLPMPLILRGLRAAKAQGPIVIYLHPWELDEGTPRLSLSRPDRFITYHNVGKPMRRRLETLLDQFEFSTMADVLNLSL